MITIKGIVFDIQHFSVHDGPGIRTTVFLKGCPLNCVWCHNPESKSFRPQLSFLQSRCVSCRKCEGVCPNKLHSFQGNIHKIDYSLCTGCGACVKGCPTEALTILGKEMTCEEVISEVAKDRNYYENTGGGVTFSGGEALSQFEFLLSMAKKAKEEGLHVAVETSGFAAKERYAGLLTYADLFLLDYKLTNESDHKLYTGVSRKSIDENMEFLCTHAKSVILRCPIIPTFNNNDEHFEAIAALEKRFPEVLQIELLPYHNFGASKARQIGNASYPVNIPLPDDRDKELWLEKVRNFGSEKVTIE